MLASIRKKGGSSGIILTMCRYLPEHPDVGACKATIWPKVVCSWHKPEEHDSGPQEEAFDEKPLRHEGDN